MEIRLKFFEDDAGMPWGLSHPGSIDNGFNSFWSGTGVFHDIMEHYFEGEHKYFRGNYAYNVAGELVATGHTIWYVSALGLGERLYDLGPQIDLFSTINDTLPMIEEAVIYGYCRFGAELLSQVPRQSLKDSYVNYNLYSVLSEYEYKINEAKKKRFIGQPEDEEYSILYRKSLSATKVRDLITYGYKQASKLVPINDHNRDSLRELYEYILRYTTNTSARDLSATFQGMIARITPGEKFQWSLKLIDDYYRMEWDPDHWETQIFEYENN